MQILLIDTCGWIDFLRPATGSTNSLGDLVEQAISDDSAAMCGVSVAELLQGAKGKKEKQQLELLFATVPVLAIESADWHAAGLALQALRTRGITVPLTDALIAAVALRNNVPLLTVDAHFEHLGVERRRIGASSAKRN